MFRISQALVTHLSMLMLQTLSPHNPREYLQLSTLLKLRAHCLKHTWDYEWGRSRYVQGGGIKVDLSKCIMAQVICVYIEAGKFIFYYSRYCINPIDNSFQMCADPRGVWAASTGLMERLTTKFTSVPLAIFIFSGRATFSSLWQCKRKCFPASSVSTVHSERSVCLLWVTCVWFVSPPSIMPGGHFFPPRLWWLKEVKRHLAVDGLYFRQASLVISLPHFLSIFPNVPLRHVVT